MASESTRSKGTISLYANLLDPDAVSTPGEISRAPVVFKRETQTDADTAQKHINAALRFQPISRPQLQSQKSTRTRHGFPSKPSYSPDAESLASGTPKHTIEPLAAGRTTSLADWTFENDEDDAYFEDHRQRNKRKRRKKNRARDMIEETNWDDIYDPSRPTNFEEYLKSDERIQEIRDWKDHLYSRAKNENQDTTMDEEEEETTRASGPKLAFAPPLEYDSAPPAPRSRSPTPPTSSPHVREPPVQIPDDVTGEDAYARRLRMSQQNQPPSVPAPPAFVPSLSQDNTTISRAPVRYNLPPPPAELPATDSEFTALEQEANNEQVSDTGGEDESSRRSTRPGQSGFASRLLKKYGWTSGQGLGASGTGIITPLSVKPAKQKKRADAEGGGFATSSGMGKIVGGKRKAGAEDEGGKFGKMSEVIVLRGMLDGLDVAKELDEGTLVQEVGEECGDKYGRVERVFIPRDYTESDVRKTPVFVHFTSQLSALRAVNALDGRVFSGNVIEARFYPVDNFENGVYD